LPRKGLIGEKMTKKATKSLPMRGGGEKVPP
jgi:hypothetical protein